MKADANLKKLRIFLCFLRADAILTIHELNELNESWRNRFYFIGELN